RGHLGRMRAGTPAMERGHLGRMRAGTPAMERGHLGRMRAGTPALPGKIHYPAQKFDGHPNSSDNLPTIGDAGIMTRAPP
ncbi:MAG: hypothetical protein DRI77_10300, partial [Chloroflexi bacterium]